MEKNKVLIVEDEGIVALDLKRQLEKLGFEVTNLAYDYSTALNSVRVNKPDIILMDIKLESSSKDGIEIAQKIQTIEDIPIIYSTAFSDENTIQRAIKTNPVSYLVKPYNKEEIKSNIILGLYKRNQEKKSYDNKNRVHIGYGYFYDFLTNKLYYQEKFIKLSSRENLLLRILIKAKGNYVEFSEISSQIWLNGSVSDSTLRTLIYRLRSKLEYKIIETTTNFGCRLDCNFQDYELDNFIN
jgi:DNA-binding response OmpR family regulator